MTSPVFLHPGLDAVEPGTVVALDGPEGRHAVRSLRVAPGEHVTLVDGLGRRVQGRVLDVDAGSARVQVDEVTDEPPAAPRITVVQALPKSDRAELAVEVLTEIGVDEILPWSARNCVTQWKGERVERGLQRWRDTARAAAKQSRRSRLPLIPGLVGIEQVQERVRAADLTVVLDEGAATPIAAVAVPAAGEVLVVVGPEGGIAPEECEALRGAGAHVVRLGPTVLRTSTAGVAAVAVLLARTDRWDGRMQA